MSLVSCFSLFIILVIRSLFFSSGVCTSISLSLCMGAHIGAYFVETIQWSVRLLVLSSSWRLGLQLIWGVFSIKSHCYAWVVCEASFIWVAVPPHVSYFYFSSQHLWWVQGLPCWLPGCWGFWQWLWESAPCIDSCASRLIMSSLKGTAISFPPGLSTHSLTSAMSVILFFLASAVLMAGLLDLFTHTALDGCLFLVACSGEWFLRVFSGVGSSIWGIPRIRNSCENQRLYSSNMWALNSTSKHPRLLA